MRKGVVAFGGMIAALVVLVVAFMGPWYAMNVSGSFGINGHVSFYLTRMEASGTFGNQDLSVSVGYADAKQDAQTAGVNTDSFTVIENAMYLTFFAIIFSILALIGMAAFVFQSGTPRIMKYFGGVFALLAFVLAIIPVFYVMNTNFSEEISGFWFSQTILGVTVAGNPGYAWYLMIVAAVLAVICGVAFLVKKTTPEPVKVDSSTPLEE